MTKRLCCVCPKEATLRCLLCDNDICFEHIKTHDAILNGDEEMTEKIDRPHIFYDFLKDKCMDCYNVNKNRMNPRKNCKSWKVLACPKHAKELKELWQLMKDNPLPRLPRTKGDSKQ